MKASNADTLAGLAIHGDSLRYLELRRRDGGAGLEIAGQERLPFQAGYFPAKEAGAAL